MQMPTGPGIFYEKREDEFKMKSMLQSGKPSSLECLEWLQWEQARCPQPGAVIQHAHNFGEKKIAGYSVDGYLEVPGPDGDTFKVVYQYYGCYWHFCPWKCTKSKAKLEDAQEDMRICGIIGREVDRVIIKRSCEWAEQRNSMPISYKSPDYCFLGREENSTQNPKITEEIIFEKIKSGEFYGIIRADVRTPPEIVKKYENLNFPMIFRKLTVTEDMLSEKMKELAKVGKKDFPAETRSLTWNATDIILTTPTVQFYQQLGMEISELTWAAEFKPTEPFTNFVNGMVQVRINAKKNDNKPLGERAKFCLNSCVGRFG